MGIFRSYFKGVRDDEIVVMSKERLAGVSAEIICLVSYETVGFLNKNLEQGRDGSHYFL